MDFSKKPARQSTFAYKWEKYKGTDILPMWIADTEFECAPAIIEAMKTRVDNGLFGYTLPAHAKPSVDAIIRWCKKQYGWDIESDWVVWTPGVVPAFNVAIQAYTTPGEGVIVQTPNYPPLLAAPQINGRKKLEVPTLQVDGRPTLDFETLEKHASRSDTRLFIICNPMNPVGSALTQEELEQVADICERHQVILCSDEIHCDLILEEQSHLPASAHQKLKDNSITLMAASKTFNIAGLGTSFAIIPNQKIRASFNKAARGIVPWVNVMGLVATEAAFTQCDDWHQSQLAYLKENRDYLVSEINKIDGLSATTPQATFLLWVDASGLGVDDTQKWCEERGVGPSPGRDFGEPNCFRLNFGCSREYLKEAISKLSKC